MPVLVQPLKVAVVLWNHGSLGSLGYRLQLTRLPRMQNSMGEIYGRLDSLAEHLDLPRIEQVRRRARQRRRVTPIQIARPGALSLPPVQTFSIPSVTAHRPLAM